MTQTAVTTTDCNAALRRIASRLTDCLTSIRDTLHGLQAVTERKCHALVTDDVAALESHIGDEEAYGRYLAELNAEREVLYGSLVDPEGQRDGMIRSQVVADKLPESHREIVRGLIEEIRLSSRRLREQIEFNIEMARRSSRHVQGLISILYGAANMTGYDARGRTRVGESGMTLVNRRA